MDSSFIVVLVNVANKVYLYAVTPIHLYICINVCIQGVPKKRGNKETRP